MKRIIADLGIILVATAVFVMIGCTAAQLAQTDAALGGTPVPPTTAPSTQPGQVEVVPATAEQQAANLANTVASKVAAAVAPVFPWGTLAAGVLGLVATVAGVFSGVQSSKLSTAQNVIAAAAPKVAALVQQTAGGSTVGSAVASAIPIVAPEINALLAHPSAQTALQLAGTVAGAAVSVS